MAGHDLGLRSGQGWGVEGTERVGEDFDAGAGGDCSDADNYLQPDIMWIIPPTRCRLYKIALNNVYRSIRYKEPNRMMSQFSRLTSTKEENSL